MKTLLPLFLLALLFNACSRGGAAAQEPPIVNNSATNPPGVEIHTPAINEIFTTGSNVSITGRISDVEGLYRGNIKIVNDANGTVVKDQHYEIHGFLFYNYNLSQVLTVTTATDFTITVSFEDHGLNSTSRSVKIKVNP